jgi:soluble lytic murein transglycosylase-like protein
MTPLLLAALAAAPSPSPPLFEAEIQAAIADVAEVWPVPRALVRAVIHTESAFNARAVSRVGAVGLMQVMPATAAKVGVDAKRLFVPADNILAGVRLLAALLKYYEGDVVAALIAYNSGPKAKAARVPDNGETPAYVLRILERWRHYAAAEPLTGRPLSPRPPPP